MQKSTPILVLLLVLPVLLATSRANAGDSSADRTAMSAGFSLESFTDTRRQRPIMIDWWYPTEQRTATTFNYGLGRGRVAEGAPLAEGKHPLVLLSHGALGSARNYSWIAEHLARSGFLVAGISHFGESYVYGTDTVDPAAVLRWWERPSDVTATLDFLESDSKYAASVDTRRIAFIGHSSGGATALLLAGATFDEQALAAYCRSDASSADRGCDYGRGATPTKPTPKSLPCKLDSCYQDLRIRSYVALDPALGPAFSAFLPLGQKKRLLIIGSLDNDFLPYRHHAGRIAKRLKGAAVHPLTNGEGHFVYLNECRLPIVANGVQLCVDRPEVSRSAVQADLKIRILDFLTAQVAG